MLVSSIIKMAYSYLYVRFIMAMPLFEINSVFTIYVSKTFPFSFLIPIPNVNTEAAALACANALIHPSQCQL